jgi:hypothetical protein
MATVKVDCASPRRIELQKNLEEILTNSDLDLFISIRGGEDGKKDFTMTEQFSTESDLSKADEKLNRWETYQ